MEKVIKIQSENSVVQTFDNSATFPSQKLFDFKIPRGEVYDLSASYVAINIEPVVTTNPAINGIIPVVRVVSGVVTNANIAGSHAGKQNLLVKNAQLYSQGKGMLESIRRQDCLALAKHYLENDEVETVRDLNLLGDLQTELGVNRTESYYLDEIKVSSSGNDVDTEISRIVARDHKIHLKDVFGICNTNAYDTNVYGETQIHWEMNLDKFGFVLAQGLEAADASAPLDAQAGIVNGTAVTVATSTRTYENPHYDGAFCVGQAVRVIATGSNGPRGSNVSTVIKQIDYSATTGKLTYTFTGAIFTATSAPENFTAISIVGQTSQALSARINGAELVLVALKDPKNVPASHDYITYSTEEINGNSLATINKQIKVEPNAQSIYITSSDSGEIAPDRDISKYRLAIDNVDITGNREIDFGKSLHKDRLIRAYRNKSVKLEDLRLRMNKLTATQATRDSEPNAVIVEAMPLGLQEKNVNLELTNSANCQDVRIYKELVVNK